MTHVWALRLKNPSSEALKKKFLFLDEVNIIFRDCMERYGIHSVSLYLWCKVDTSKLSGKPDEILGELAWFLLGESGNTKSQLHVTEEVGIGHQVKIISCRGKKNFELTQNAAQRTSSILVCKYPCLFQISLLTTLRSGMALLKRELSCHPCCCHLLLPLTLPY